MLNFGVSCLKCHIWTNVEPPKTTGGVVGRLDLVGPPVISLDSDLWVFDFHLEMAPKKKRIRSKERILSKASCNFRCTSPGLKVTLGCPRLHGATTIPWQRKQCTPRTFQRQSSVATFNRIVNICLAAIPIPLVFPCIFFQQAIQMMVCKPSMPQGSSTESCPSTISALWYMRL